jgi:putative endopeptidase
MTHPAARLALTVLLATSACLDADRAPAAQAPAAPATSARGLDIAGIDGSVRPGDDFYAFANGSWLRTAEIPADRSSWGPGNALTELNLARTAELIQGLAAAKTRDPEERKIADYYASFMDEHTIEARGLAPLRAQRARIAAIRDRRQLASYLGSTLRADVDVLNATNVHTGNVLGLWVAQDLDNPKRYLPFLLQGGLGMPDRDYYLSGSDSMKALRKQYLAHIEAILRLAKHGGAEVDAGRVFSLESRLAQRHATRGETASVARGNNHWQRADFAAKAPGLDWAAFFAAAGLGAQQEFLVWHPGAVTGLAALAGGAPLEDWRAYLDFHALEAHSAFLPRAFVQEEFAFHSRALEGTPAERERWKRAIDVTNGAFGDAIGKRYVARWFPPEAKARIEAMVHNLMQAFAARIDGLAWMAPETRAEARAKLAALKVGVGYPDHWRDYSGLTVRRDDAYGNVERAAQFNLHAAIAKLARPVDRSEWVMTPQTVNAVNLPAMNALNFPAGILQAPYFDLANPDALNYGAIGAVIGHEISHSFDDEGAQFDSAGRFRNWWQPSDLERFRASAAALARQYDAYRPFPDLAVRGEQTLSENIADVAGLSAAYDAFRREIGGKQVADDHGYNPDQQFFIAFAQNWRRAVREPALRRQVITDSHAPAEYRGDTVRNLDAWYRAFGVQPGEKLYLAPEARVPVW